MAATVNIYELNGAAPGTPTSKTSGTVRFKQADDATVDLNDPMVVPPGGSVDVSFEKWLRLRIDDAGGFTQIDNLRAYTDGAPGFQAGSPTEVDVFYATSGTYRAPAQPADTDPPQVPEAGSPQEDMTALFTATSGSPVDLDAVNTGPFTDGSPTEFIGDFLILAMVVRPGASQGVLTSETLTFAFDEI